jgi:hypothetical protein
MPNNSQADVVTDWEATLTNVIANAAELPNLDIYKEPVERILREVKAKMAGSKQRRAVKQEENKELRELLVEGREAMAKLRAAIKAHYGPKSERLIEYGMRPQRPRRPKSTDGTEEPEPEEPTPVPSPETAPKAS